MQKVLLTGASGRIGQTFFIARQTHYNFTLTDVGQPSCEVEQPHQFIHADLTKQTSLAELCNGVDAIVHLAGVPDPNAEFAEVLPANILSTTYLLEAAKQAGVKRFVFASSAQTIEGYPVDRQIASTTTVAPANLYGVSKCYGEALCSYYATRHNMTCISLRIGAFEPKVGTPLETKRDLSAWLSHEDAVHLIDRAINADIQGSFIAHGISNNRFKRLDLTETREILGYNPQDDAFETFPMPPK